MAVSGLPPRPNPALRSRVDNLWHAQLPLPGSPSHGGSALESVLRKMREQKERKVSDWDIRIVKRPQGPSLEEQQQPASPPTGEGSFSSWRTADVGEDSFSFRPDSGSAMALALATSL